MANCKYCKQEENKQSSPCLTCKNCNALVHLDCLNRKTPGGFAGDVFFIFTCKECSNTKEEMFERGKVSWFHCLVIVLFDLKTKCSAISNQGYFHWRTHIGTFINRNWNILFHPQFKMKKNWAGTFSGTLSQYSPVFFKSGSDDLNQSGWWKLSHALSPSLIKHISSEMVILRQNDRTVRSECSLSSKELDHSIFLQLVNTLGFSNLLSSENSDVTTKEEFPQTKIKTETSSSHSESIEDVDDNNYMYKNEFQTSGMDNYLSSYFPDGEESMSDFDSIPPDFEEYSENSSSTYLQAEKVRYLDGNETANNYLSSGENCDSDNTCHSNNYNQFTKPDDYSEESNDSKFDSYDQPSKKFKDTQSNTNIPLVKSLFSQDTIIEDSDLPWQDEYKGRKATSNKDSLVIASEYEEVQMLNYLNILCRKAQYNNVDKKLIRLRAKLALRKLKRSKHILPEWNLDSLVCQLAKFPIQEYSKVCSQQSIRVLDRYQQMTESLSGTTIPSSVDFATRLAGTSEMTPFLSPYSGRLLKPYIRRDFTTISPWTKLMNELVVRVNGDNHKFHNGSLDYCYVRPQFIPSINSLCEQYFWSGIDLTETLQYPDFSCVVLYKKLIVGFAFLVPDVAPNEAYVSFIFTRPQWRRSGIAKFMLYHLIQTCIHKDITLHVSATSPAILLYQKFGFKIEELIQDFYDKYFSPQSTECKHALFLRLCR